MKQSINWDSDRYRNILFTISRLNEEIKKMEIKSKETSEYKDKIEQFNIDKINEETSRSLIPMCED